MLNLGQVVCGAENGTLRKVGQKYLKSFEMWCWRRMEKISWTDDVGNGVYWKESRRGGMSEKQ
jgi:hypothetical protein